MGEGGPEPQVQVEVTGTPFKEYLVYQRYRVQLADGQELIGGVVFGPGHHVSGLAALVFDARGTPYATFKTGDTRLARASRGEPYVAINGICGRWDKAGYSAGNIVLAELAEEVGGQVVDGTFRHLGDHLNPTMPFESTESEECFLAAIELVRKPYGDGGQMEVPDLIGPVFLSPGQTIRALDEGRISDAARARAAFARAWDAIGYIPSLELYVQDHPALAAGYDTLGLGPVDHLRERVKGGPIPDPPARADTLRGRINTVLVDASQTVELAPDQAIVDARIRHAVRLPQTTVPLAPEFASQFLWARYDRAKVAVYYLDPKSGPMVEMAPQLRPGLSLAPGHLSVLRRDLRDLRVKRLKVPVLAGQDSEIRPWERLDLEVSGLPGPVQPLSMHSAASSGQSDLYYHNLACRVDPGRLEDTSDFVTLAEAIRLCRTGQGDVQSEATLLRLADRLEWLPQLGMSRTQARELLRR